MLRNCCDEEIKFSPFFFIAYRINADQENLTNISLQSSTLKHRQIYGAILYGNALILIISWFAVPVFALPSASFVVSSWDMKDGLPLNKVRAVAQTLDGYLWVGTFNGLARFDGVRFKLFDTVNCPGLQNNAIESLCVDGEGHLWVGNNLGGISVLVNDQFRAVALPKEWTANPVLRLAVAGDGTVWAMNDIGLMLPFVKGVAGETLASRASPIILVTDNSGRVLAPVAGRLCQLDATKGAVPLEIGPELLNGWRAIFPAQAGGLWILDGDSLRRWNNGQWVEDRGHTNWGTIVLPAFLESRSGIILGGSFKEGIQIVDQKGGVEEINESNGLSHNWAYCLFEDREGNVWVGTGNGGLNVLYPRRVTMVNASDKWRSSAVLSVVRRAGGGLWIGTEGAGVYQMVDNKIEAFSLGEDFWSSVVNSVLEDRTGRLWVGTWSSGLLSLDHGKVQSAFPVDKAHGVVLTVFESSLGDIWVGTKEGPGRLRQGKWTWFENQGDMAHRAVRCFAEQGDGTIWFGLDGDGVCRLDGENLSHYSVTNGLVSDYVQTLYADTDGAMWIGTHEGLSRFKNGKFANVTKRNGLPNDVICQILDDGKGNYWISSLGGVFRVVKSDLNRCADGNANSVVCLLCDSSGGLNTLEMSSQGQPAGCRTSDGRLWFATGRGLAMIVPNEIHSNLKPPPVRIEELLVDREEITLPLTSDEVSPLLSSAEAGSVRRLVTIPPGGRQFEFRYTGLSFANPAQVAFCYRLEGLSEEWIDAGSRRSAFYTHIQPGNYTFKVIARNADGVWNKQGASLTFRVLPYFSQTLEFKLGCLLGGAAAVGLTVWVIVRQKTRRKLLVLERQRAVECERTRIARDIHDDLGSSLTHMFMMSESARAEVQNPPQLAADLDAINRTGRELTLQLSEIVWALSPEHDTLDSLAAYIGKFAHDFLGAAQIRCRLDLPIALPANVLDSPVRHNVFLAFKESLNNIVKHSHAKNVKISLRFAESELTLIIEDDGCGLSGSKPESIGHGLANLNRRMTDIGGRCEIQSQSHAGTCVRLIVPLNLNQAPRRS